MPATAHPQASITGHPPHAGRRRRHTVPPSSMIDWFHRHAGSPPAGAAAATRSSAIAWASAGRNDRPAHRARTRPTLVSTTPTGRSKANASTARAVYGPTPGQRQERRQVVGQDAAVPLDDGDGRGVEVERPPVVPEPGPQPHHLARRCRRTRRRVGEAGEEGVVAGDHAVDLGLLGHHLGDEDGPRVAGRPPRQGPEVGVAPGQQVAPSTVRGPGRRRDARVGHAPQVLTRAGSGTPSSCTGTGTSPARPGRGACRPGSGPGRGPAACRRVAASRRR